MIDDDTPEFAQGEAVEWRCDGGAKGRGWFCWDQDGTGWATVEQEGGQLVNVPAAYLRRAAKGGGQLTLL